MEIVSFIPALNLPFLDVTKKHKAKRNNADKVVEIVTYFSLHFNARYFSPQGLNVQWLILSYLLKLKL
jgi:hypothetical protein